MHAPYQALEQYLDKYQHIAEPSRRAYAVMITSTEEEIGKVVAGLAGASGKKEKPLDGAKSLFLVDAFKAVVSSAHGAPALPNEDGFFTQGD